MKSKKPCKDKYNIRVNSAVASNISEYNVKGSIKSKSEYWIEIGANSKIVDVVKNGYKLPLIDTPLSANFSNNKSALQNQNFVSESIASLIESGCVIETSSPPKVVNPLSVNINHNGKKRLILDLRYINKHLIRDYIKFQDWTAFEKYVSPGSFAYKFDLKQGYHHVDIFEEHQTHLGFSWVVNGVRKYFVFTVLPFGLSTAPGIFTKIIRPLVAHWHEKGIQICVYLDDGAGIENDLHKAKNHSEFVKKSPSSAGFIINTEKSVWEPLEKITWILTLSYLGL